MASQSTRSTKKSILWVKERQALLYMPGTLTLSFLSLQVYCKAAEGNWVDDPKTFIGAVLTMHQIMLDHTVKLFVSCLRVIVADMKAREGKVSERSQNTRAPASELIFVVESRKRSMAG
jgi:hypothetical protein